MGLINYSNISDGTSIDANDVNNPFNTVYNEFNGNIEAANIKNGSITQEKLANYADVSWSNVPAANTVSSVTTNGNRSYDITFGSSVASILSPGMRIRTTRSVGAPTQCTDLESSSSQGWTKATPAGLNQTDDVTFMTWVKLESYSGQAFYSQRTGNNGWDVAMDSQGWFRIHGVLSAGNYKLYRTYAAIPLNKWTHIAATMDMSGNLATFYIDGESVPYVNAHTGTANSFTSATTLNIGNDYGFAYGDCKLAQMAIFSSVLSQATIRSYMSQTLVGNEPTCIGLWKFNGDSNDSSTNANNLTAVAAATATNADSPFGGQADGSVSSTLDYGIVTSVATTTATVAVPAGSTIPTTGGLAAVAYSTTANPYGFPPISRFALSMFNATRENALLNASVSRVLDYTFTPTISAISNSGGFVANHYLNNTGGTKTMTGRIDISSTNATGNGRVAVDLGGTPFSSVFYYVPGVRSQGNNAFQVVHGDSATTSTYAYYYSATSASGSQSTAILIIGT